MTLTCSNSGKSITNNSSNAAVLVSRFEAFDDFVDVFHQFFRLVSNIDVTQCPLVYTAGHDAVRTEGTSVRLG